MSDSYRKQIEDRIWTLLEARTALAALVLTGNRLKETSDGWLREKVKRAPNDFPQIQLAETKYDNPGFDQPMTYGMQSSGFPGADAGWLERPQVEYQLTITARDVKADSLNAVEEQVRIALKLAGANLGLSFVLNWGSVTATRKSGFVQGVQRIQTVMKIPVQMELLGKTAIINA